MLINQPGTGEGMGQGKEYVEFTREVPGASEAGGTGNFTCQKSAQSSAITSDCINCKCN